MSNNQAASGSGNVTGSLDAPIAPPTTGLPEADDALRRVAELSQRPVGEHPDVLAAAHEALHIALQARE
ncbi:MAG: hypothetical protein L0H41_06940 [Microlunatus sp.]|nr:hypothetical protein [Microlunatus sp.]MDN5770325.1 hypothetical protein [Microlunatus sp.]MDN5803231.1 hypothetical protein [Microlunatus sp.]